jgi:hypothetical protein
MARPEKVKIMSIASQRLGFKALVCGSLLLPPTIQNSRAADDQVAAEDNAGREATLHVANYGADSADCGTQAEPCRSITQAINKAEAGFTVIVGPGRYGDINGDGDFSDPGDEQGDSCVVCLVRSGVRVVSQEGAAVTLIDATGTTFNDAVMIVARNSQFGERGRGFRVLALGGPLHGISVSDNSSNIKVAGNIVTGGRQGAYLFPTIGRSVTIADNIAVDTIDGPGFSGVANVIDPGTAEPARVVRNISIRNLVGFGVGGPELLFTDNIADNNVQGAFLGGEGSIVRRNSIGNSGREGVLLDGGGVKAFTDNSVIGNRGPGVTVFRGTSVERFVRNNIYGNGTSETPFAGEPQPNCGLLNASRMNLIAPNNFWGLPSGPGPDPADEVCNILGSTTVVEPVAVRPFRKPPSSRESNE